jgi:predicted ATP-dependent serine protease
MIETRIKELVQLNYTKVITSKKSARELSGKYAIEIIGIARAQELEDLLF